MQNRPVAFEIIVLLFVGTSVELKALLTEIKQKDKQREQLLMELKVCFAIIDDCNCGVLSSVTELTDLYHESIHHYCLKF